MADAVEQVITPAPAAAPEPSPIVVPVSESVAPAQPDLAAIVTAAPGVADVSSPATSGEAPPAAETPKVEEGFKPTILDELDKPKEEAKPEVKAEEAKPVEGEAKPAEIAPVELPKIDYFAPETGVKLPETLKMDDAQKGEFVTALDSFRADPSKGAQQILDMGVKAITAYAEEHRRDSWKVWNETQTDWQNQVKADPILGGAGHDTAMISVGQGRNRLASPHKPGTEGFTKDLADFNEMARITGVGNHPVFLRMLHRAGKLFAEAAPPPPDPRPAPDNGRRPGGRADLYKNTKFPGQA